MMNFPGILKSFKTKYGIVVGKMVCLLALFLFLQSCSASESFLGIDTLCVENCTPSNGEKGVGKNISVSLTFSSDVDKNSAENAFSLSFEGSGVDGKVTWNGGKTLFFKPTEELVSGKMYFISVERSVRDARNNTMEEKFLSSFIVGDDNSVPLVVSSDPVPVAGIVELIPINQDFSFEFSKPMDIKKTESAFSITPSVEGFFEWSGDSRSFIYRTTSEMQKNSIYKVSISSLAEDVYGIQTGSEYVINLRTSNEISPGFPDFDYPQIVSVLADSILLNQIILNDGVSKKCNFIITFSESMEKVTTEKAFNISPSVIGDFLWNADSTQMTFVPREALKVNSLYTINLDNSACDLSSLNVSEGPEFIIKINANDSYTFVLDSIIDNNSGAQVDFTSWPALVNFGTSVAGESCEIDISFVDNGGNHVNIKESSVYGNIITERLNYLGSGSPTFNSPVIDELIVISATGNIRLKLKSLDEDFSYRVKLIGGDGGIEDLNGNTLDADKYIDFKKR